MNGKRIGEFLKEQRIKNNLTQDELASKLYVSRYVISKWERGIRIPSTDYLTKLSTILNVNVTDILNGGIVNNENLNKVTIDIIKYQDKKIKHLMYIMSLIIILLIAIFSTIFLINNFNSIKVYNVVGSSEKYKLEDGLISLSKENVHMNLGNINSDTYMKYKLYFILDNNKYLIQGSDDNYIVYTNTLLLNVFVFIILGLNVILLNSKLPNNILYNTLISLINVFVYYILTYLILIIVNYFNVSINVLLHILICSIIMSIIYSILLTFILNKLDLKIVK